MTIVIPVVNDNVKFEQQQHLLLFAFRDLWKEWSDSNYQIFSQNCQFHHRRLESLEHFNLMCIIYNSEHYGLIFGGCHIIFTSPLFHFLCTFPYFFSASTLCMFVMYLTSFDSTFYLLEVEVQRATDCAIQHL